MPYLLDIFLTLSGVVLATAKKVRRGDFLPLSKLHDSLIKNPKLSLNVNEIFHDQRIVRCTSHFWCQKIQPLFTI